MIDGLAARLARVLGPTHVSRGEADRIAYARDLWPRGLIRSRGGEVAPNPPDLVCWPADQAEVSAALIACSEAGVPVVPYGAGSGVCGGTWPVHGGVVMDVKRLRRLHPIDQASATVRAEAGIIGQHLEEALNARGWTLGHFPSSIYCSTVGGWVAARSAGQFSSRYGKIEDMTQGLTAVLPDGTVIELDRDRDGPDWVQALVGSEGTLAVITDATLAVSPLPEHRILRGWRFPDVPTGTDAMRRLMQAGLRPCVARLYDEFDTMVALSGGHGEHGSRREGGDRMGGLLPSRVRAAAGRMKKAALRVALARPSLLNRAAGLAPGGCLLVMGFEGERGLAKAEATTAAAILRGLGAADLGEGPAKSWFERRYAISYKQPPTFAAGAWVDTMEVATTWAGLVPLYHAVRRAVEGHAFVMAHFSHAYTDGCSIYFTYVGAAEATDDALRTYDAAWAAALGAVVAAGAAISHHHGIGLAKAARMVDEQGPGGRRLFDAAKAAFDPGHLMNPGKLWTEADGSAHDLEPPAAAAELSVDRTSLLATLPADTPTATFTAHVAALGLTAGPWVAGMTVGEALDGPAGRLPSPRYGPPRHRVVTATAILPDGTALTPSTAPRHATGPDYLRMVIGAGGALGSLRDVTLRLWPAPEVREVLSFRFPDAASAKAARRATLDAGVLPAVERREGRVWSLTLEGGKRVLGAEVIVAAREAETRGGRPRSEPAPPVPEEPRRAPASGPAAALLERAAGALATPAPAQQR